jgi:AcrR family transcriptional regulator
MSGPQDTSRQRFLECAESMFVEEGYRGTTIRAICSMAGTSLAILNRNWSSKEELFREMLDRHFAPLHQMQNAAFERLEAQPNITIEEVLSAFFMPALEGIATDSKASGLVYSRALIDSSSVIKSIVSDLITPTRQRLIALVSRTLKCEDPAMLFAYMNVIFGAYVYPQAFGGQLARSMSLDLTNVDWRAQTGALVDVLANGLTATFFPKRRDQVPDPNGQHRVQ